MGALRTQQKSNIGDVHIKQSLATQDRLAQADVEAAKVNGTEKTEKGSPADQAIAQLKEQIERVKQQIEALLGDDSPEAKEQRKMLQKQLSVLNGVLLSAMDNMLKAEQQNS